MRVGVISIDSEIGACLAKMHRDSGDFVWGTTRTVGKEGTWLELSERDTWPTPPELDRIYFTIAVPDHLMLRGDVMRINSVLPINLFQTWAPKLKAGTEIVVFTSQLGSITLANTNRAMVYRMSKAALNMGIKCLSMEFPQLKWCVYHPGLVNTKMINGKQSFPDAELLDVIQASERCMTVINSWDGKFRFLSYTGKTLDF